jgi:hypothetical protein
VICVSCWERIIKEGNKLFDDAKYIEALEKYKSVLPAFKEIEELNPWLSMQDLMELIDCYIVSCHKVSTTLAKIDGTAERVAYAYKPLYLLKAYTRELDFTEEELEFIDARFSYSLDYYENALMPGNPKLASKIVHNMRYSA